MSTLQTSRAGVRCTYGYPDMCSHCHLTLVATVLNWLLSLSNLYLKITVL
jgi:hypothetical protein